MFNKKRIIVFVVFILLMFFMMTFAGAPVQNAAIATRKVVFTDGYNGRDIADYEIEVGTDVTPPEAPEHDNYVFAGWYDYYNQKVRVNTFTTILNDTHVIALYGADLNKNGILDSEEDHYLVTFVNSINNDILKEEEVLVGMDATAPEAPSMASYNFVGWDRSYRNVKNDITVSTVYNRVSRTNTQTETVRTYTVTFIDSETDKIISNVSVQEGLSASTPTVPTHEGKVFDKWEGNYTNVRSNETVNAIYTDDKNNNGEKDYLENHYTVKFDSIGKGHLDGKTEYNYILTGLTFKEAGIVVPTTVADEYYEFDSWDKDFATVTENVTYTASFKATNDKLSENGGSDGIADEEQEYTLTINYVFEDVKVNLDSLKETRKYDDRKYEINTPVVKHYTADKTSVSGLIGDDGKLSRVEVITYKRNEYTVTFKNYDDKVVDTQKVVAEESATAPENPTRENTQEFIYTFDNWDKSFNKVESDLEVIALYSSVKQEYKIEVNPNCEEDKCETVEPKEIKYGDEYELPSLQRTYVLTYEENENVENKLDSETYEANLLGYCKGSKTCNTIIPVGTKVEVTDNETYYAVWEAKTDVKVKSAEGYKTLENVFTFSKWNNNISANDTITLNKNTTLTASYHSTPRKYNLVIKYLYSNDKDAAESYNKEVVNGTSYSVVTPNVPGYTPDKEEVKGNMPTEDVTVEVRYTANNNTPYKVEHYIKNINDRNYSLKETEYLKGITDTYAEAEIKKYDGVTYKKNANEVLSGIISGKGNLTLRVYYDRNTYQVTVDPNCEGDNCETIDSQELIYGMKFELPELTREYTLTYSEDNEVENKLGNITRKATLIGYCTTKDGCEKPIKAKETIIVENNVTYYAMWDEEDLFVDIKEGNGYLTTTKVMTFNSWINEEDNKENLGSKKLTKSETLTAKYDSSVRPYDLTITYRYKDGTEAHNKYSSKINTGENYSVKTPEIPGYTPNIVNVEGKMPTEDVNVEVVYTANLDTPYKVNYHLQKLNEEGYDVKTDNLEGKTDTEVTLENLENKYEGFTLDTTKGKTIGKITGDGKLVLDVYYNRNKYNVVVEMECNDDACQNVEEEKQYGDKITLSSKTITHKVTYIENSSTTEDNGSISIIGYCKNTKTCEDMIDTNTEVSVSDNVTYYAQWDNSEIKVNIKSGSGYQTESTTYKFVKWEDEEKNEVKSGETTLTKDITLNAIYDEGTIRQYEVLINRYLDDKINATKKIEVNYGEEIDSSEYATEVEYYKFVKSDPEKLKVSSVLEDNVINIYYEKLDVNVKVTTSVEANNPAEYNDTLTYSITIKNTGTDEAEVLLVDKLLIQALNDGNVVLGENEDGVDAILTSDGYKIKIKPSGEEDVTLKVIVRAQAGTTCESQLTYTVLGESKTTDKITVKVEKTISYVEKTEKVVGSNIAIVLDESGSMSGNRMMNAKKATVAFINEIFKSGVETNSVIYVYKFGTYYNYYWQTPYSELVGSAKSYNEAQKLITKVNNIDNNISEYSLTPYYKGLESAYNIIYDNNGLSKQTKYKENQNVVLFLTDGNPYKDDDKLREEYITKFRSSDATIYTIGYGDITEDSEAYSILTKLSGASSRVFITTDDNEQDLLNVFKNIGKKVSNNDKSTQTSSGVAKIGAAIADADADHPIVVNVNDKEFKTFNTIEEAIESGIISYTEKEGYTINAAYSEFKAGDAIELVYYNLTEE